MPTLEAIINDLETIPSLKAIALALGLPGDRLYGVAKTPKEGEVYNAKVYNWDAIERFVTKRLNADKGVGTLPELIEKAQEIDEELKNKDGRRIAGALPASKLPTIEVEGKQVPTRKFKMFEMDHDPAPIDFPHPAQIPVILLKGDKHVYGFVYQTAAFTVLQPVGADGAFCSEVIRVVSNATLNGIGYGPTALTREAINALYA